MGISYRVYQYFKDTRAGQMLVGLLILLISSFIFNSFGLSAMSWLVNQFQTVWVVAFVILFQPEIRRLLIYIGQTRFFQKIFKMGTSRSLEAIVDASVKLAIKKVGCAFDYSKRNWSSLIQRSWYPIKSGSFRTITFINFQPRIANARWSCYFTKHTR